MNPHSDVLNRLLELGRDLPPEELPQFLGTLTHASAVAMSRLRTPVPQVLPDEKLLTVVEAAELLGVKKSFLYHRTNLPFVIRMGSRLRYSRLGILKYIENQKGGR
jgi:hypothetical protein